MNFRSLVSPLLNIFIKIVISKIFSFLIIFWAIMIITAFKILQKYIILPVDKYGRRICQAYSFQNKWESIFCFGKSKYDIFDDLCAVFASWKPYETIIYNFFKEYKFNIIMSRGFLCFWRGSCLMHYLWDKNYIWPYTITYIKQSWDTTHFILQVETENLCFTDLNEIFILQSCRAIKKLFWSVVYPIFIWEVQHKSSLR